jgi:hypothetical protein
VARALSASAPRWESHLRFPLLSQILWLLDLRVGQDDPDQLLRQVKAAIRHRRRAIRGTAGQDTATFWANVRAYAEGPLPAWTAAAAVFSVVWAERLTVWLGFIAIIAGMTAGAVHLFLLSRSWAGARRYRWFLRQPYLMPPQRANYPTGFNEFAVRLLQERRRAEATSSAGADIECLLVNAFLEDLRQGYERRLWKVWRRVTWARTAYPVLLIEGGQPRLVQRVEQVRADMRSPDPLFVVVAAKNGPPPHEGDEASLERPARPEDAVALWQCWRDNLDRDRSIGSCQVLRIEMDSADTAFLEKASVPVRTRRRPALAHPLLPLVATASLVAASFGYVVVITTGRCAPGVWRAESGECVGISNGDFAFHPRLKGMLDAIHDVNVKIEASGRPYVTVVFFGSLSLKDGIQGSDMLADIHGELAGVALEQRRTWEGSNDGTKLQLRILIANAGEGYKYAADVAEKVLRRADEDDTIVGAVGLGASRKEVQRAIKVLSRRALPMISTAATFDDLGRRQPGDRYLPTFFPLAPPNTELAARAARWARAGLPEHGIRPARSALVFMDTTVTDLYSKDLGIRFAHAFGRHARNVEYSGAGDLERQVTANCVGNIVPDLVYYAGRSEQFGPFVAAIAKSRCHSPIVMAGDAVTQYVNDHANELSANYRIRLLYTPLAAPGSWANVPERFRTNFYDDLDQMIAEQNPQGDSDHPPSREYAALASDAADAVLRAAQDAYSMQYAPASGNPHTHKVDRAGVLLAVEQLEPVDGASGLVKLHGARDGQHALDRPVLLVTVGPGGRQVVVRQCGQLYAQQPQRNTC